MPSTPQRPTGVAVLTSGGDAAGMNAAVRALVRSGLTASGLIGLQRGNVHLTSLTEPGVHRPHRQSWMALRPVAEVTARTGTAK